jgi:hypothetical protein
MNPFLQGRKSAEGLALSAPQSTSAARLPGMIRPTQAPAAGPQVEVVKEGNKVVRIVVKCACGERLEVECLYSS